MVTYELLLYSKKEELPIYTRFVMPTGILKNLSLLIWRICFYENRGS